MTNAGVIRVASFNLHGFVGSDGRRDAERCLRTIESLDADVVAVQEFRGSEDALASETLEAWGQRLGLDPISGYTLRDRGGDYGNAVFTRLPVRNVLRHRIAEPAREPRAVVDLELEWEGGALRVLATHLGLAWSERRRQIGRIAEIIESSPTCPTILAADTNDWSPGGWQLRPLRARLTQMTRGRTFPTRLPLLAIDRIAASADLRLEELPLRSNAASEHASDHRPLLAELRRAPDLASGPKRMGMETSLNQAVAAKTAARSTGEQLTTR